MPTPPRHSSRAKHNSHFYVPGEDSKFDRMEPLHQVSEIKTHHESPAKTNSMGDQPEQVPCTKHVSSETLPLTEMSAPVDITKNTSSVEDNSMVKRDASITKKIRRTDAKPSASLDLSNGKLSFTVMGTPDISPTNFPRGAKSQLTATLCITSADFGFLCSTGSSDPEFTTSGFVWGDNGPADFMITKSLQEAANTMMMDEKPPKNCIISAEEKSNDTSSDTKNTICDDNQVKSALERSNLQQEGVDKQKETSTEESNLKQREAENPEKKNLFHGTFCVGHDVIAKHEDSEKEKRDPGTEALSIKFDENACQSKIFSPLLDLPSVLRDSISLKEDDSKPKETKSTFANSNCKISELSFHSAEHMTPTSDQKENFPAVPLKLILSPQSQPKRASSANRSASVCPTLEHLHAPRSRIDMNCVKSFISKCRSITSNNISSFNTEGDTDFMISHSQTSICSSEGLSKEYSSIKDCFACMSSCPHTCKSVGLSCGATFSCKKHSSMICPHIGMLQNAQPLCSGCAHQLATHNLIHTNVHSCELNSCAKNERNQCHACKLYPTHTSTACNMCTATAPMVNSCFRHTCRNPTSEEQKSRDLSPFSEARRKEMSFSVASASAAIERVTPHSDTPCSIELMPMSNDKRDSDFLLNLNLPVKLNVFP